MKIIRSNDEQIRNLTSKELGGKGYHLVQLSEAAFNVPPFLIITNSLLNEIFKNVNVQLSNFEVNNFKKEEIIKYVETIQSAIQKYEFSPSQIETVLGEFDDYFGADALISVRSSGAAEDGESASFAGQHATFLYVNREEILDKVKACMASAWSLGVISYRIKQGISLLDVDFAVVLQKMIFATKSGIGFSMNPSGNLADAVIVAGYGIGEGIVSDQVESDTYLINRQNSRVSKTVRSKRHHLSHTSDEGLAKLEVKSELIDVATLTNKEILIVYDVLLKAEKMLDGIADIEFCFDDKGEFFILQTRPVTSVDLSLVKLLDNTNIVESYPGISLPLTFSFARHAYEKAFQGASKAFWIPKSSLNSMDGMFEDLLGYHQGRIYYRLDNWYKMITLVFSSKKSIESWEKAVGLKRPPSDELKLSFGNKLKVYASTIWRVLNYKRGNRKFFELFNENYQALRSLELGKLSLSELSDTMDESASAFFEFWYLTLINDLMTFKSFDWVQKGIERRKLGSKDLANDLISGIHQSESEISIIEVLKLKDEILSNPSLVELFEKSSELIWEVMNSDELGGFSSRIKKHIDRFGDRTLGELKLENPSFRKEPWRFMDLLKGQLKSAGNLADYTKKQQQNHIISTDLMTKAHRWWSPRSHFFKYAIRTAAYGTRNREDMRFCRTRIYGAVKDIYGEIGLQLHKLELIEHANDIFYLNSEEISAISKSNEKKSMKAQIEERKVEFARDANAELPDRIIYTDAPPIFKANKSTVDHTNSELDGIAVSKGIVRAEAIVISQPSYDLDVLGKIIITEITDPGWVFLMSQASGLISEKGSLLSHTAIVGREMGIPVIVSVEDITKRIKSGDVIEMDGQRGTVKIIERTGSK